MAGFKAINSIEGGARLRGVQGGGLKADELRSKYDVFMCPPVEEVTGGSGRWRWGGRVERTQLEVGDERCGPCVID
jgi:hypothetical protein